MTLTNSDKTSATARKPRESSSPQPVLSGPLKLAPLRAHLGALRRRRWSVRMGTAWSALAVVVLWAIAAVFAFDVTLEMSRTQRGVALLLVAGVVAWGFGRFTRPFLGMEETDLDLALLVERRQRIDSDLVAALQFESPDAARWGSVQLEDAVIDYVADFGNEMNVFEGLSYAQVRRRLIVLAVTASAVLVASAAFPGYANAFLNRLLLGSAHYPSRTVLQRIAINGVVVFPVSRTETTAGSVPRIPYGQNLRIEVQCTGAIPESGEARLTSLHGDLETAVKLGPVEPAKGEAVDSLSRTYAGEQPRLVDSVNYQLYLGDAWTDPARIDVIEMPVVNVELHDTPPTYAAGQQKRTVRQPGSRQISVVEGSRVDLKVLCGNKPLKSATLLIEKASYPLQKQDDRGSVWALEPSGTPFAAVIQPVSYQIQVEDEDGLTLDHPIQGYLQIQVDRGPRIAAAIVTDRVLPNAVPTISYGATDDYGLAMIRVHRQVIRAGKEAEDSIAVVKSVPAAAQPQDQLRGSYRLQLAPLKLAKGDEVRITLEAIDYRGKSAGKSARSEPLVLQVTDESGILAGLVEADQKSSRQLDAIIQRQLGIGETR